MKKRLLSIVCIAALAASCASSESADVLQIETPSDAMVALKAGNERFVTGTMLNPRSSADRREQTLNSQSPYAVIVTCSDSRVPAELIFDQGIGDLFVIRTAGNSVADDVVMGSIDYAVDHLNTPLVVVMGHENCGGVTSTIAVSHGDEEHAHHGKIGELLEVIRHDVEQYVGHPEQLDEAIRANATAQVARITDVEYIRERIDGGKLRVVSAYYDLDSGVVSFDE